MSCACRCISAKKSGLDVSPQFVNALFAVLSAISINWRWICVIAVLYSLNVIFTLHVLSVKLREKGCVEVLLDLISRKLFFTSRS